MKAHRRCVYAACWDQVWPPRVPNIRVLEVKNPTYLSPPSPLGVPPGPPSRSAWWDRGGMPRGEWVAAASCYAVPRHSRVGISR